MPPPDGRLICRAASDSVLERVAGVQILRTVNRPQPGIDEAWTPSACLFYECHLPAGGQQGKGPEVSRSDGNRPGLWLCLVSLAEADAEEPIDHHGERQDGEDGKEDRAAQESGKDLLLAEEERACCDEESKAHAPEVTRDARSAGMPAASEHTDVSSGGEQEDGCHEEAHASGGVLVGVV